MTVKSKYKYLNKVKFMEFAHRGASVNETENSVEAFSRAYKMGFKNFELDVHSSLDEEVFVFHDDNLRRLAGKDFYFGRLSKDTVKSLLIDGNKKIPTLLEIIKKFPDAQLNIDAKSWKVAMPLCRIIEKTKAQERICIGGFNDFRTLKIVRRLGPKVCYSFGPLGVAWFFIFYFLNLTRNFSAGCLQLPEKLLGFRLISKSLVKFAHKCGVKVHVWTVNDESIMKGLIDLGVDGIMTDNCAGLKNVLMGRELWRQRTKY